MREGEGEEREREREVLGEGARDRKREEYRVVRSKEEREENGGMEIKRDGGREKGKQCLWDPKTF